MEEPTVVRAAAAARAGLTPRVSRTPRAGRTPRAAGAVLAAAMMLAGCGSVSYLAGTATRPDGGQTPGTGVSTAAARPADLGPPTSAAGRDENRGAAPGATDAVPHCAPTRCQGSWRTAGLGVTPQGEGRAARVP